MEGCDGDSCKAPQQPQPTSTFTTTFFPPNFCRFPGTPTSHLNPGTISNLHKKVRDLTPEWIEGLCLRCAKNLDVNKTLYGQWLMGNNTPIGFRFGGMLCKKDNDNITKTPLFAADTNPSTLATNLHFLYHPIPQIRIETKIQTDAFPFASDFRNAIGLFDYLGKSSTISLALYNAKRESGRMTIGFLQSFNNNFCAGAEMLTAWNERNRVYTSIALAARYSFERCSAAMTISMDALDVSVWSRPKNSLQLGASFIFNKRTSKTIGSFYYQMEMKNAVLRGMIDSDWSVGCTYNRQLKNLASAFGFSVLFCIPSNKFYCGLTYELNSNLQ